ncbi:MAG: bacteriohemerythrin [Reinekea sp.]
MKIIWSSEYELGIPVIDGQHQRIVEYINRVQECHGLQDRDQISEVLYSLVDYTFSHFAFEEALLEEIEFEDLVEHRAAHEGFVTRVDSMKKRYDAGEDVVLELTKFLQSWLLEHILSDDASYSEIVKAKMLKIEPHVRKSWIQRATNRFFLD